MHMHVQMHLAKQILARAHTNACPDTAAPCADMCCAWVSASSATGWMIVMPHTRLHLRSFPRARMAGSSRSTSSRPSLSGDASEPRDTPRRTDKEGDKANGDARADEGASKDTEDSAQGVGGAARQDHAQGQPQSLGYVTAGEVLTSVFHIFGIFFQVSPAHPFCPTPSLRTIFLSPSLQFPFSPVPVPSSVLPFLLVLSLVPIGSLYLPC